MTWIIGLLALSALILIHEIGHFAAARFFKVRVLEFSIFMGPKLASFTKNDIQYTLRAIPLGGYVRMEGEEAASDDAQAFNRQPVWKRMIIILAGPLMNIVTALVIMMVIFMSQGHEVPVISKVDQNSPAAVAGVQPGDRITRMNGKSVSESLDVVLFTYVGKGEPVSMTLSRNGQSVPVKVTPEVIPAEKRYRFGIGLEQTGEAKVLSVGKGTPAEKAGILPGDVVLRVNDREMKSSSDINEYMSKSDGTAVSVTIRRDGKDLVISQIVPALSESPEMYVLGVDFTTQKETFFEAIPASLKWTWSIVRQVVYSIVWLVTGQVSSGNLMGPVGLVQSTGSVIQGSASFTDGLLRLLSYAALISVNVGAFNLIPFPALDGSKIVLYAIEAIRRKPLPPEREALISLVGFVLLIGLMLYSTSNDVMRLIGR